mmetsp:Transcript_57627/g.95269  ORF Transcript_57627/g.95269 Transcript_57627/m.95269 type:complete len:130 (-) Transcript_57627:879-1268(-)
MLMQQQKITMATKIMMKRLDDGDGDGSTMVLLMTTGGVGDSTGSDGGPSTCIGVDGGAGGAGSVNSAGDGAGGGAGGGADSGPGGGFDGAGGSGGGCDETYSAQAVCIRVRPPNADMELLPAITHMPEY